MTDIQSTAKNFFEAVDTGQGWSACRRYCTQDASFWSQAEPLAELKTLEEYTEWMKSLLVFMPDADYKVRCFGIDEGRRSVSVYAVFTATHTGEGGPCPPTGKRTTTDYVYVMDFEGDRIRHMTKIWNSGWAVRELGWA